MKITLTPSRKDDLREIRGALKLLQALGGGVLELAPGTYTVDNKLEVPNGCTIVGGGKQTKIK